MNAGTQSIDDKLRDTDQDGPNALVSDTQDLLPIAADDYIDVLGWAPTIQDLFDLVRLVNAQEAAFGSAEQSAVVCNRIAFLRCCDQQCTWRRWLGGTLLLAYR